MDFRKATTGELTSMMPEPQTPQATPGSNFAIANQDELNSMVAPSIPSVSEPTEPKAPTAPENVAIPTWKIANQDELKSVASGNMPAYTPQAPIVAAPPLVTKVGDLAAGAFQRIGQMTGIDAMTEFGKSIQTGNEMIKEGGLGVVSKAAITPQFKGGALEDITGLITKISPELTHLLSGIVPVGNAVPAPTPARQISSSVAWLLGAGLTGKALGMGITKMGLMATPGTFIKLGLTPAMANIAARGLGAAEVGAAYGGIGVPFLPKDESKLLHVGKMAAAFGVFGSAEGMLEGIASKIPAVGEIFKKINTGETLTPKEQTIAQVVKVAQLSAMGGGAGATEPAKDWKERLQNSVIGMASFGIAGILPFPMRKAVAEMKPEDKPAFDEAMKGTKGDGSPVAREVRLAQLLSVTSDIRANGGDNRYIADMVYNMGRSFIENNEAIPWEQFDTILSESMHNAEKARNEAAADMGTAWHRGVYERTTPEFNNAVWGENKPMDVPEQLTHWEDLTPAKILGVNKATGIKWYENAPPPAVIGESGVPTERPEPGVPANVPRSGEVRDFLKEEQVRKDFESSQLRGELRDKITEINNTIRPGTPEHTEAMRNLVKYVLDMQDKQDLTGMDVGLGEMADNAAKEKVIQPPEQIGKYTKDDIRSELTKGGTNLANELKSDLKAGVSPDGLKTLLTEIYGSQAQWIKENIPPESQTQAMEKSNLTMSDIGKMLKDYEGGIIPENTSTEDNIKSVSEQIEQAYENTRSGITGKGQMYNLLANMKKEFKGKEGYNDVLKRIDELKILTKNMKKPKKVIGTVSFLGTQSAYDAIVDGVKGAYDKVQEVTPDVKDRLIEFGKDIYETGQKFSEFVKSFKDAFGDFFGKIKDHMVSIYESVKKFLVNMGEGGFVRMPRVADLKIDELTREVGKIDPTATVEKSIDLGADMAKNLEKSKDKLSQIVSEVKGTLAGMWNKIKNPEPWSDYKKILGDSQREKWIAADKVSKFAKTGVERIPDERIRAGLQKYLEADGDMSKLRDAAKFAPDDVKWKYEIAMKLPGDVRTFADMERQSYTEDGNYLLKMGWLDSLQEHYVRRLVESGHKGADGILSMLRSGLFRTNPGFLKQRMFDTTLEGELSGTRYRDDGILSMSEYKRSYAETIANRTILRELVETGKSPDGMPLAMVSGMGIPVPRDAVDPEAIIIKPHAIPEDYRGHYITYDNPNMRKWFWMTSAPDGTPIVMQGDLLLHESIAQHFKNMTGYSKIKQYPAGRILLRGVREFKGILLAASPFHQVQTGTHAIFHKVNPFNLPVIDANDPLTLELVSHGLNPNASDYLEYFEEGSASTGILTKIPGLGGLMEKYNNYVFGDFIPRMKVAMAKRAFLENFERYKDKYSRDQILEFTAKQADAAFGELNYKWMGRNPTAQDIFRLMALAPDFLEARGRFLAQAATGYGREQRAALFRATAGMMLLAKTLTAILNDDNNPHWERPLSVVVGDKEFMLRSVPGDLAHLIQNPRSFIYHRLNPTVTRTMIEALSGRNELGQQRYVTEQFRDFFATHIPIPLQFVRGEIQKNILDSAFTSMGLTTYQYKTDMERQIAQYMSEHAPKDARTLTEISRMADKKNILTALQQKKPEAMQMLDEAVQNGEISSYDRGKLIKDARKTPVILGFSKIPFEDAIDIFGKGTPEEQKMLLPYVPKKFSNAMKHASPNRQVELKGKFDEFMNKYGGK